MTPSTPKLPQTMTVNRHALHIDSVPNASTRCTWTITEHLSSVTVGHPPLHYEHGLFTTETSTGIVSDPDWHVVLEHAFARA